MAELGEPTLSDLAKQLTDIQTQIQQLDQSKPLGNTTNKITN